MFERIIQKSVVELIESHCFSDNPHHFHISLNKTHHPLMLTPYTVSELSTMKLYKLTGHDIGFGIKDHGNGRHEIVAVHNNDPVIRGIGKHLISAAIRLGGNYLNHFDVPMLNSLYENAGLIEVGRIIFDPEYDPGGIFEKTYGRLDIIDRELFK